MSTIMKQTKSFDFLPFYIETF